MILVRDWDVPIDGVRRSREHERKRIKSMLHFWMLT